MKMKLAAILLAITVLLLPVVVLAQPPGPPLLFQGEVSINGEDAPAGTIITAEIDGVEVATNKPGGITKAGYYSISVKSDDIAGKIAVFKVNGIVAGQFECINPMEIPPTVDLDLSITGAMTYALTITSTEGGSVSTPGEGTFSYNPGKTVNLATSSDDGYQFDQWTGDVGTVADVNASATTILMDADKSITAVYTEESSSAATDLFGGLGTTTIIIIAVAVVVIIVIVFIVRSRRSYR